MVCVPCIFLPILMAIYLKFIQPYILRILPERWATFLDPILYPTCPIKIPPSEEKKNEEETKEDDEGNQSKCCPIQSKKDQ